ncbi:MAG: nucleotidyltransferase domain-containing protein [Spirochaetales bacterium]|nr:nucleotidyltransferase domain-containing protein [Spirochaetales bacterium]
MSNDMDCYDNKYLNMVKEKLLELSSGTSAVIFLFGSRADGTHRQGSDIDVGFENISKEVFRKIRIAFNVFWEESIVPNKVDLVYFPAADSDFILEAKKEIVVWKAG